MTFYLETLGGLRLLAEDGVVNQVQRRRLALMALLAAAGERGLTRDQLLGFLWPDATQDAARHALNQLVYGIRRSLSESVLAGVDPLRLDPSALDADVRRFEAALAAGDDAAAVSLYRGPFLHGFYLADAPAFDPRVERERARLAAAHAEALERLATRAEARGDVHDAVRWRRSLAELDALDSCRAMALMRALDAAGDSSGALAHARAFEALVRRELDASPSPEVRALAREIKSRADRRSGRVSSPALAASPSDGQATRRSAPAAKAGRVSAWTRALAPPRTRTLWRIGIVGLAAAALAAAWFGVPRLDGSRPGTLSRAPRVEPPIAVRATNERCDEAIAPLRAGQPAPPAGEDGILRGQCFAARRMWPEAIAEFRQANELGGSRATLGLLGHALARSGRRDEARRILADLLTGRQNGDGAFGVATVYAGLGDFDRAFEWLERADESAVRLYIMGPMFDDLRRDPRFATLRQRLNR